MVEKVKLIPIYTTSGDWCAMLAYPHIYSTEGEWLGWVTPQREVFDVNGAYVGMFTDDLRVVRRVSDTRPHDHRTPPKAPPPIQPLATVPLPPMMAELAMGMIDVFEEEPFRMRPPDHGVYKEDVD